MFTNFNRLSLMIQAYKMHTPLFTKKIIVEKKKNFETDEQILQEMKKLNLVMSVKIYIIYFIIAMIRLISVVGFFVTAFLDMINRFKILDFYRNNTDGYSSQFISFPSSYFTFSSLQLRLLILIIVSHILMIVIEKKRR